MPRLRLVHWKAEEAESLISGLRSAGHEVDYDEKVDGSVFRSLRLSPPDAFVIDLSRLPSHGREVATLLRGSKATRHVPIVFVDGAPEKLEAIRGVLPDAVYSLRSRLRSSVRQALARPPASPVVPAQMMDRYASRTAAQKLGIVEGSCVALIDPPGDYLQVIGQIPDGVTFDEDAGQHCPVTLWFVADPDSYRAALPRMRNTARNSRLWAVWPKQSARKGTGVSEQLLRDCAIAVGLVDYKVCSVNHTWSALLFARRKP